MLDREVLRTMGSSFEIRLGNAAGIPVLRFCGKVTTTTIKALDGYLRRLADAGHFEVVLNMERAEVGDWRCLSALAGTVESIKSHYGSVNLVATQDKVSEALGMELLNALFKICRTESEAISRIKRLLRHPGAITETNARLLEPR